MELNDLEFVMLKSFIDNTKIKEEIDKYLENLDSNLATYDDNICRLKILKNIFELKNKNAYLSINKYKKEIGYETSICITTALANLSMIIAQMINTDLQAEYFDKYMAAITLAIIVNVCRKYVNILKLFKAQKNEIMINDDKLLNILGQLNINLLMEIQTNEEAEEVIEKYKMLKKSKESTKTY